LIGQPSQFAKTLLKWYWAARRDLPWRPPLSVDPLVRPDAYRVLLSELMLQQTQVVTVIPYFHRFLESFPTIVRLAAADEQQVLRLWQGLGYYSRARNLHRAAKAIVAQHDGRVPHTVDDLLALPGIGRYTAGAIASIAYDTNAPILDGNVLRVLCRLDAIREDPRQRIITNRLWSRAEELLPAKHAGDFNSALMELGATICTVRNPQCDTCPVHRQCQAHKEGIASQIPPPKQKIARPLERRAVFCVECDGRWLIEQRPATGRWANMWQFLTILRGRATPVCPIATTTLQRLGTVEHDLTHRRYHFTVYRGTTEHRPIVTGQSWVKLTDLSHYPLTGPHLRIAAMLRA
jgi:A/G-specific adenine glycosylase